MSIDSDAVVVGAGPNGLAAAITLARAGVRVTLIEAGPDAGGAMRSRELTLSGFVHDVGSTVQALAQVSPFFRSLPLAELGVTFAFPEAPFGQTLEAGEAAVCETSIDETARRLGRDGPAYRRLFEPLARDFEGLLPTLLGPPFRFPRHPLSFVRFGLRAIRSARGLARSFFAGEPARALYAGAAAHSILPLEFAGSAAFGLVLGASAHGAGWPVVRGGSQVLADALCAHLRSLGGRIELGTPVTDIDELAGARAILCAVGPRQLARMAGHRLPSRYVRALGRFRYGPGTFKLDWALSAPVPWKNPELARAGTVHLGASLDELAASERASWYGQQVERPFVLLVQPSLFDPTRAPPGKHTLWAYCRTPNGCDADLTELIERQIERFAPGFRDVVLARSALPPSSLERFDANLVGGDITGGANLLVQTFTRPVARFTPYRTPRRGLYLCSASTPPGGGVHGMSGYNAATVALRDVFGIDPSSRA